MHDVRHFRWWAAVLPLCPWVGVGAWPQLRLFSHWWWKFLLEDVAADPLQPWSRGRDPLLGMIMALQLRVSFHWVLFRVWRGKAWGNIGSWHEYIKLIKTGKKLNATDHNPRRQQMWGASDSTLKTIRQMTVVFLITTGAVWQETLQQRMRSAIGNQSMCAYQLCCCSAGLGALSRTVVQP